MVSLYGEDIAKMKPHLMHHVPRQMQKKEANMSCFPGERAHIVSKAAGEKNYGDNFDIGVLRNCVRSMLHNADHEPYVANSLLQPTVAMPMLAPFLNMFCATACGIPTASKSAMIRIGGLHDGCLLVFNHGTASFVGIAQC